MDEVSCELHAPADLHPNKESWSIKWMGGSVYLRAGLQVWETLLLVPEIESRIIQHVEPLLYQLLFPEFSQFYRASWYYQSFYLPTDGQESRFNP